MNEKEEEECEEARRRMRRWSENVGRKDDE